MTMLRNLLDLCRHPWTAQRVCAVSLAGLLCVFSPVTHGAGASSGFSFDQALAIYNSPAGGKALLQYLATAPPAMKKDHHYFAFKAYAEFSLLNFTDGEEDMSTAISMAVHEGISGNKLNILIQDLKDREAAWKATLVTQPMLVPAPSMVPQPAQNHPGIPYTSAIVYNDFASSIKGQVKDVDLQRAILQSKEKPAAPSKHSDMPP